MYLKKRPVQQHRALFCGAKYFFVLSLSFLRGCGILFQIWEFDIGSVV